MVGTTIPSGLEHCQPCAFEEVAIELPADASEFLQTKYRQRALSESGAVRAMVADSTKLEAVEHIVEDGEPDDYRVIKNRPNLLCAQTILRGECELFMVRKTGPQAGQLAPRLRITG